MKGEKKPQSGLAMVLCISYFVQLPRLCTMRCPSRDLHIRVDVLSIARFNSILPSFRYSPSGCHRAAGHLLDRKSDDLHDKFLQKSARQRRGP